MAVVAPTAHATLLLSGSINGTNFCASDQNVGCGFGMVQSRMAIPTVNQLGLNDDRHQWRSGVWVAST